MALPHLTDQDLKDIGVLLEHRRIMLAAIGELAATPPDRALVFVQAHATSFLGHIMCEEVRARGP